MGAGIKASAGRVKAEKDVLALRWKGSNGNGGADSSLALLESAVLEVNQLTAALTASQRQADSSQQKAAALAHTTSQLRLKLVDMTKLVEHVRHFAYHDELTGLPNRALLMDRLRQATVLAVRDRKQVALLMLDVDHFKQVNDAHGHGTGDDLLKHIAWLISTCVRGSDTVCRYGGDEFVIMLPEIESLVCATSVVEKIHARLAASFFVEGELIPITASIGVALYPGDSHDIASLIRHADARMYELKGRNTAGSRPPALATGA